jgi:hypothetical protein
MGCYTTVCRPVQEAAQLLHIIRGSLATKRSGSAPRQIAYPGGLTPPRKAVQGHADLYSMTGRDLSGGSVPSSVSYSS